MIRFTKGRAPTLLTGYRATHADWGQCEAGHKEELRDALLRDQSFLCAYCQRRIKNFRANEPHHARSEMHVDHWRPRSVGGEHFAWQNLIGSCAGDPDAADAPNGHCDASKKDATLFLHPVEGEGADPGVHLSYGSRGNVTSEDPRAIKDIATLQLNIPRLTNARRRTLDLIARDLERRPWTRAALEQQIQRYERRPGEKAPEHADVIVFRLRRWVRRLA